MERISLELLGTTFQIVSNDPRWVRFLSELFEPFLVDENSEATPFARVYARGSGWVIAFTDERQSHYSLDPWALASYLRNVLSHCALQGSDSFVALHAAVLKRDREGLLLVGPAGSGKSTLTRELIRRGWEFLSDDVAPLTSTGDRVLAFPKPLSIKRPNNFAEFSDLWSNSDWLPEPTDVLLIPPAKLRPVEGAAAVPNFLVFPKYEPDRFDSLRTVSSGDAVARCGCNLLGGRTTPAVLRTLKRVCGRASSAEIRYSDSIEAVDNLLEWIQGASSFEYLSKEGGVRIGV